MSTDKPRVLSYEDGLFSEYQIGSNAHDFPKIAFHPTKHPYTLILLGPDGSVERTLSDGSKAPSPMANTYKLAYGGKSVESATMYRAVIIKSTVDSSSWPEDSAYRVMGLLVYSSTLYKGIQKQLQPDENGDRCYWVEQDENGALVLDEQSAIFNISFNSDANFYEVVQPKSGTLKAIIAEYNGFIPKPNHTLAELVAASEEFQDKKIAEAGLTEGPNSSNVFE